jgi:hypothetical protein
MAVAQHHLPEHALAGQPPPHHPGAAAVHAQGGGRVHRHGPARLDRRVHGCGSRCVACRPLPLPACLPRLPRLPAPAAGPSSASALRGSAARYSSRLTLPPPLPLPRSQLPALHHAAALRRPGAAVRGVPDHRRQVSGACVRSCDGLAGSLAGWQAPWLQAAQGRARGSGALRAGGPLLRHRPAPNPRPWRPCAGAPVRARGGGLRRAGAPDDSAVRQLGVRARGVPAAHDPV